MRRVLLFVGVLLVAYPCSAQTPKAELSAGYNFLRFSDENFPGGWYGEVAGNVGETLAIVGQVSGNYKSIPASGINVDTSYHAFAGGVRFLGRGGQAAGFGHVLFGFSHASASSNASGFLPVIISATQHDSFVQVGAGVNLLPSAPIGLRIGGDYARVLTNGGDNVLRLALGIVVPFGR